jgi:hypothetical protein
MTARGLLRVETTPSPPQDVRIEGLRLRQDPRQESVQDDRMRPSRLLTFDDDNKGDDVVGGDDDVLEEVVPSVIRAAEDEQESKSRKGGREEHTRERNRELGRRIE